MRKAVTAAIVFALSSIVGMSGQEPMPRDTVKIIENASSVTVVRNGDGVTVTVKGINGSPFDGYEFHSSKNTIDQFLPEIDFEMPFLRTCKKRHERDWGSSMMFFNGMYVGMIRPLEAPDGMLASWEWGVSYLFGYSYRFGRYAPKFSVGTGIALRWYNVGRGYGLSRASDELLIVPVAEDHSDPASRFSSKSITVSAGFTQRIAGSLMLALTATLDFNVHTTGFYKYYDGGKEGTRHKIDLSHLHQRVMRWDFMASLGFESALAAYVRYSPVEVFAPGYGPRFRQLAMGLQFIF